MNQTSERPAAGSEGHVVLSRAPLIAAALAVIDDDGDDVLSVRSLARRTFYSSSAVGYWVSPFPAFKDDVWEEAMATMVAVAVEPYIDRDDWADGVASAMLSWADARPRLARFCVGHRGDLSRHAHALGMAARLELADLPTSDDVVADLVAFVRHVQVSLERAIASSDRTVASQILAADLEVDVERTRQQLSARRTGSDAERSPLRPRPRR